MPLLGVRAIGVGVEAGVYVPVWSLGISPACCIGVFPVYSSPGSVVVAPVHLGYPRLAMKVLPMKVTLREHFRAIQVGQAMAMGWPRE